MARIIKSGGVRPSSSRQFPPTTPGEVIEEEWLKPTGMSQSALANKIGVHVQVVNGIVRGRRAVTATTAVRLSIALRTSPQFWMNLQSAVDIWEAERDLGRRGARAPAR